MLGLKRGSVRLCEHEKDWEAEAENTIIRLKKILGNTVDDIQHVGSTAIVTIKAKPIIDIAVAVENFPSVLTFEQELKENGFYYRPGAQSSTENQLLFACGNFYDGSGDLQTHFIHVVLKGSIEWKNYINFRDYLNSHLSMAKKYEDLKLLLASEWSSDEGREGYTKGKQKFIHSTLREAFVWSYLGKMVDIQVDRPLGSSHPKYKEMIYPVNYGFLPNVFGGNGEELDVYLLGVDVPVKQYRARIIGIVHRKNDIEDKLVAAPENMNFSKEKIEKAVYFQEQYYKSEIEIRRDMMNTKL